MSTVQVHVLKITFIHGTLALAIVSSRDSRVSSRARDKNLFSREVGIVQTLVEFLFY